MIKFTTGGDFGLPAIIVRLLLASTPMAMYMFVGKVFTAGLETEGVFVQLCG
jgi:hypothetical protein